MAASTHHEHYQLVIDLLRETRQQRGLTQAQLSELVGNTQTFVSKIERGERRLDVVELIELVEALNEEPDAWLHEYLVRRAKSAPKAHVRKKISARGV